MRRIRLGATVLVLTIMIWASYVLFQKRPTGVSAQTGKWESILRLNSRGVAFMEQLKHQEAAQIFRQVVELDDSFVPAHVNLGIALFYQQEQEQAQEAFQKALQLDPKQLHAHYMLGLIYRNQDQVEQALREFSAVHEADPRDPATNYFLGLLFSRTGQFEQAIPFLRRAIEEQPYNQSAYYRLAIALMRSGQQEEGARAMEQFRNLQNLFGSTTIGLQYLEQGKYAQVIEDVRPYLPALELPASPPIEVTFEDVASTRGLVFRHGGQGSLGGTVSLGSGAAFGDFDGDGWLDLYLGNTGAPGKLFRNQGGRFTDVTSSAGVAYSGENMAVLWGDYDNDGDLDLYLINRGPNVLYRNNGDGTFSDVTEETGVGDPAWGVSGLFVDYDHDGDLDLFIANLTPSSDSGPPDAFPEALPGAPNRLYRNNGNGTFTDTSQASGLGSAPSHTLSVLATDIDNSRDTDFLVLNWKAPGQLFRNLRDGTFADIASSLQLPSLEARTGIVIGDFNQDTWIDLVLLGPDWPASRLLINRGGRRFDSQPLLSSIPGQASPGFGQALDFDNDGDLDLLVAAGPLFPPPAEGSPSLFLLANEGGRFRDVSASTGVSRWRNLFVRGLSIADYDNDGDLDILANVAGGSPLLLENRGGNRNHWLSLDLTGTSSNRFGIGTKVEIAAGLFRQKQEVYGGHGFLSQSPSRLHFGLGTQSKIEVLRLLWPGGVLQAELDVEVNQRLTLHELDRKGTSCPILYVWDGKSYRFVTDFLGGSAFGYLLAPGVYNYPDTDEYIRLEKGQYALKNGHLAITMNNQLEEVIFFDQVQLVAVDHPDQYTIYPDEKLLPGPPYHPFRLFTVSDARPPVAATDGRGRDILPFIQERDRTYPPLFRNLPFKGYAEQHELILDLGSVPGESVLLLMDAWIDYADSSSNYAAAQSGLQLIPPYLQVRDEGGNWVTVVERMGFPAGLPKTMTVDLSGKFLSPSREVRIVTNMRIYWDRILVESQPQREDYRVHRLSPKRAQLRFGGFPLWYSPDGRQPNVYDYRRKSWQAPWKVHIGGYTRFGDVLPLLLDKDDRFVITRSGDEIEVLFDTARLPALPPGWERDFLIYVVGFGKDMDLHSAKPDFVGPLPFHAMSAYPYPPQESYPDSPAHREYLERWNTRFYPSWIHP